MNIRYKNYVITHDGLNYVVNSVYVRGDKANEENKGKEALRPLKFYSTLKLALKSIRDMVITDSLGGVDDIDAIIRKIESCDKDFEDYLDGAY
jgi:hypothetical protein